MISRKARRSFMPGRQSKTILWSQQVGTGFSSVSVADGRLYTMGNTNQTDKVFCLEANTGEILWTHSYLARLDDKNQEGGPNATPTVADGKVYVGTEGNVLWVLKADKDKEVISRQRMKSTPITVTADSGVLYVPTQRYLYAYKAKDSVGK